MIVDVDSGDSETEIPSVEREEAVMLFNRGNDFSQAGDTRAAEGLFRQAAEQGHLGAMRKLGNIMNDHGDFAGAEKWYRLAAERGDTDSMYNLGLLHGSKGDVDEAEGWFRRAAESGDAGSMYRLGVLFEKKHDVDQAELWYKRAAESKSTRAMINMGILLSAKGDIVGAERWYRDAADLGDADSMYNLGLLLKKSGRDPEESERWFQRAAESGVVNAMDNLAHLLLTRGDLDGAGTWYRSAAVRGNVDALYNLGIVLSKQGDTDGAEYWYRRAAEAGTVKAMDNLAILLQNRGDLYGAELWYKRGVQAGSKLAKQGLAKLKKKKTSDRHLESITFDTFGWRLSQNDEGFRQWEGNGAVLAEKFFDVPAGYADWDLDEIRGAVLATQGLIESPTFSLTDLEVPEELVKYLPLETPEQVALLEIELFEIPPAKCVITITRRRAHDNIQFAAAVMILFAECFWVLGIQVQDDEDFVGEREGAVASVILNQNVTAESPVSEFDPYDSRWDGIVSLDRDPLTRVRLLSSRLRDSIRLGGDVLRLKPFGRQ